MKRFIIILLSALMLLVAVGCGTKPSPSNPPGGSDPGSPDEGGSAPSLDKIGTYADAYEFYNNMESALEKAVTDPYEAYIELLETEKPDTYYNDPTYMTMLYMPFLSIDLAFTATFTDAVSPSTIQAAFSIMGMEDVSFKVQSPGSYQVLFKGTDSDDIPYQGEIKAEYDASSKSLHFIEYHDNELNTFIEFISLGGDRYALQNKSNRALITYRDGKVVELYHLANIYNSNYETGELSAQTKIYGESDFIWGKTDMDRSWVTEFKEENGATLYELTETKLIIQRNKEDRDWQSGTYSYEWLEAFEVAR